MKKSNMKKWKKLEKRIAAALPPCKDYSFLGDVSKHRYTLLITYKEK